MLDDAETVERSGRKLNVGHRLLTETEDLGASVLDDLAAQREKIRHARGKVEDTNRSCNILALINSSSETPTVT